MYQDGIVRTKLAELLANNSDVHYVDSLASAEAIATVRVVSFSNNAFNVMLYIYIYICI